MSILKYIINFLKDILAPKKCYSCKKEWNFLCEDCFYKLDNFKPFCYICKKDSKNFKIHKKCLIENRLLEWKNFNDKEIFLDRVIVMTHYKNNVVKKLIKDFKFYWKKDIWEELWEMLWNFINNNIELSLKLESDLIVLPVPLHFLKKIKRWFNQSEIIAKGLTKKLNIKYSRNTIIRYKYTRQQSKLIRIKRLQNLNNSFKINKKYIDNVDKKIILVIDDVVSSWTTLNEIAKTLKKNWAKKVIWICIASN